MSIRVLLADDHKIVRQGLEALLTNEADIQIVGQACDGLETLKMMPSLRPDVLVLDISMPNLGGFEVAQQIRKEYRQTRIVILSVHNSVAYAAEAQRKGAQAYVIKDSSAEHLVQAIRAVMQNQTFFSFPLTQQMIDEYRRKTRTGQLDPIETLTPTERIVMHPIVHGLSSRQIAQKMGISARTVETHRANIMRKLQVSSTAELIRYAIERGIFKSEDFTNKPGSETSGNPAAAQKSQKDQ